jgi:integrase
LLRDNPARYVEVPSPRRPHALVWTAQRVEAWQQTGERPSVAVWTLEQTAAFLSFVAQARLAVMWWLTALRGLRRGEAAGLRWVDVDLDAGVAMIEQQRIANGHLVTVGAPKTAASRRLVALDRHTMPAAPRTPTAATGRATRGGRSVAGLRVCVRHRGRGAAAPGLPDPPVPPSGRRVGAAAGPAVP